MSTSNTHSISTLFETLKAASEAYYNTGSPIMDDQAYDDLVEELRRIDPNNVYFSQIGSNVPSHLEKVELVSHMGSQNKARDDVEMLEWYNKYNKPAVIVMDKLDGSSMEVLYENGILSRVCTRGDGEVGSLITENAKRWKFLPQSISIKDRVVVRGEAILSVNDWRSHFQGTANPRNAANGTVMRKDGFNNEYISFIAFEVDVPFINKLTSLQHKLSLIDKLGFKVVRWKNCNDWQQLQEIRSQYVSEREGLEYQIDGMIIAINDLDRQQELGYSDGGSRPKWSIAWKFEADKRETEVVDIELTVGHTGAIIPTAVLKPVHIAGATVSHALLNNFEYIRDRGINIGSRVIVQRAGDIIPQIVAVVGVKYMCLDCSFQGTYEEQLKYHTDKICGKDLIAVDANYFKPPTEWNGYQVEQDGRYLRITDPDCPVLVYQRIRNWVNKTNIKHLGDNTLLALYESGLIKDIPDLYILSAQQLSSVNVGTGQLGLLMAQKIIEEINKTRNMDIATFMGSLSIKFLGRSMAEHIGFETPQQFVNASIADLSVKDNMGINKAKDMFESIARRKDIIDLLLEHVKIDACSKMVLDGKCSGYAICFTGIRPTEEEQKKFEELGGVVKSCVSKHTTHLIAKDPTSNSNKLKKARDMGVEVVSMKEFKEWLE